ncbi:hypothetical protein K435DRAFT_30981 [Dendrothele bispora CBS 962.96]|uniref:Uncharacterized protein n=1 Tax=Dendrothele bispora (strain CBS 962.96) TaxID=1314807 RepID=A0A4S8KTZ2_DENBC|nr:hypothetical protein K435DRAFT_30981 [Dendrothele bispora CBS 962.96]
MSTPSSSYRAVLPSLELFSFVTMITLFTLVAINHPYSSGYIGFSNARGFNRACKMRAPFASDTMKTKKKH